MKSAKYISAAMTLAAITSLAVAIPVFADTNTTGQTPNRQNRIGMMKSGVVGTVSAINGNSITVTSRVPRMKTTSTTTIVPITYTVDATNATVTKNNVAGTISSIAVGDAIAVQGTLTGTNVVATTIRDGLMMGKSTLGDNGRGRTGTSTPRVSPIQGNGQPVVAGSISAISGNTLTVTNQSGVTYTVDATSAKIVQGPNTITVSNLAVGNPVVVQGTVNGTSIVASSILDQVRPASTTNNARGDNQGQNPPKQGFFKGIGSFFAHMFGF